MNLLDKIKNYEFDIIELPSRGLFYNLNRSFVYIKFLTAKEENLLTTAYLSETSLSVDMVIESVLLDDIKVDDLLLVDRKAILMFLRSKAYEDSFELKLECPKCNSHFTQNFRFSDFLMSDINTPPYDGFFEFMFKSREDSSTPHYIKIKPLTYLQDKIIRNNFKEKISTYEIIFQIHSIDENEDKNYISNFVNKMPIKRYQVLKKTIESFVPRIYEELDVECLSCGYKEKKPFKIDDDILKFGEEHRKRYENEIFLLQYYGNGGFDRESLFDMSINQRRIALEKINEEVEKKNKAEEEAVRKSKQKNQRV